MAKKFYLAYSYHENRGYKIIGLFNNKEQAKAAATLEEIKFKDSCDYDEWIDFYATVTNVKFNTTNYKILLDDYLKKEEEAKQLAFQEEKREDSEHIKRLIEAYKEKYGVDPQI